MREGRALEYTATALTIGALLLGVAGMSLTASTDGDIFWHLAAGEEMLRRGRLLDHDPFSISAGGKAWIDVHWLFQLIVAWTHERAGFVALVIGKALLVTFGALLLSRVVRARVGAGALPLFVVCFLAALLPVRELLLLRPTVFTLVFLAAFIYAIERAERREQPWVLCALPLIQVLWVNLQGLFALGPAVILAYWLGWVVESRAPAIRGKLLISGLSTLAACLVNPFGVHAIGLPGELLRRLVPGGGNVYSENVAENVPPFVLEQQSGQFWHLKWFLLFLALAVVLGRRSLRPSHGFLVGGFLVLALIANRNVLLFYWVATPIAVITLYPGALRLSARWSPSRMVGRAAIGVAIASLLLVTASAAAREPSLGQPAPFRVPELSARWIAAQGGDSRIFAADHYGGYLIWKLFPDHKPYIDTRLILRSEQQFAEYLRVIDEPRRFDEFAERHDFDYVVLPSAYPDRYLALIRHLFESPRWKLVLTDGIETLFVRAGASSVAAMNLADPSVTARLVGELQQRFHDPRVNAAARIQLATLHLLLGDATGVEPALGSLQSVQAQGLRARARLLRGDLEGAGRLALGVIHTDPDHVRSLNLLAVVSLQRRELGKAMSFLRRSARVDPFDSETLAILRSLEEPHDSID